MLLNNLVESSGKALLFDLFSLSCRRQKSSLLYLVSGFSGPVLFIVNLYQHIGELEYPLTVLGGLKEAAFCLVEYTLIFAPMIVFMIMIFVYGSLINILQHVDSQIAFNNDLALVLTIRVSIPYGSLNSSRILEAHKIILKQPSSYGECFVGVPGCRSIDLLSAFGILESCLAAKRVLTVRFDARRHVQHVPSRNASSEPGQQTFACCCYHHDILNDSCLNGSQ